MFADEAAAIYERAITTLLKQNMLLYFAYADFEEVCPYGIGIYPGFPQRFENFENISCCRKVLEYAKLAKINGILPIVPSAKQKCMQNIARACYL